MPWPKLPWPRAGTAVGTAGVVGGGRQRARHAIESVAGLGATGPPGDAGGWC